MRQYGKCYRAHEGGGPPKTALGWSGSGGEFFFRGVKSAEQITEVGQLTRPLVRFLRHPWRLLCVRGRFRNSGNRSRSARMAWPPLICESPVRKRATGQRSQATVTIRSLARAFRARGRFFRPGDQVFREVNRGRAAKVAPRPVYLPLSVFSLRTWSLPPEK